MYSLLVALPIFAPCVMCSIWIVCASSSHRRGVAECARPIDWSIDRRIDESIVFAVCVRAHRCYSLTIKRANRLSILILSHRKRAQDEQLAPFSRIQPSFEHETAKWKLESHPPYCRHGWPFHFLDLLILLFDHWPINHENDTTDASWRRIKGRQQRPTHIVLNMADATVKLSVCLREHDNYPIFKLIVLR